MKGSPLLDIAVALGRLAESWLVPVDGSCEEPSVFSGRLLGDDPRGGSAVSIPSSVSLVESLECSDADDELQPSSLLRFVVALDTAVSPFPAPSISLSPSSSVFPSSPSPPFSWTSWCSLPPSSLYLPSPSSDSLTASFLLCICRTKDGQSTIIVHVSCL